MEDDLKFMRMALNEAESAYEEGEVPIGCVVVSRGRIISRGHNLTETLGGKYLQGCTLYVTVEPCVMCAGAMGWAQLSRLVYGARDEKRGYSQYVPHALHPRCEVTAGVMEDQCREIIQRFFKEKRANA